MVEAAMSVGASAVLEESIVQGEIVEGEHELDEEEEQLMSDLSQAIELIGRARTMLSYIADPNLCKAVSERERKIMTKLVGSLEEFSEGIKGQYQDLMGSDEG